MAGIGAARFVYLARGAPGAAASQAASKPARAPALRCGPPRGPVAVRLPGKPGPRSRVFPDCTPSRGRAAYAGLFSHGESRYPAEHDTAPELGRRNFSGQGLRRSQDHRKIQAGGRIARSAPSRPVRPRALRDPREFSGHSAALVAKSHDGADAARTVARARAHWRGLPARSAEPRDFSVAPPAAAL